MSYDDFVTYASNCRRYRMYIVSELEGQARKYSILNRNRMRRDDVETLATYWNYDDALTALQRLAADEGYIPLA